MKTKKTKSDIIDAIYRDNEGYQLKQIKIITGFFVSSISDALKDGTNVEIRGLGTFEVVPVKERTIRNPKTGDMIKVSSHCKVHFKPSKDLKDSLKAKKTKTIGKK